MKAAFKAAFLSRKEEIMHLIVGLGNPEKKYEKTFHNLGFLAAGDCAELLQTKFKKKECEASVAEAYINGEKIVIARPLTYMNASGRAVKQLMAKYKVLEEELIVLYDDYDLPKGHVRVRPSGSAGTHNGMRSVIAEIGFQNFPRVRLGIRDAEINVPIIDYVLSDIRKDDYELFASACRRAAEAAIAIARGESVELVMTKYNG